MITRSGVVRNRQPPHSRLVDELLRLWGSVGSLVFLQPRLLEQKQFNRPKNTIKEKNEQANRLVGDIWCRSMTRLGILILSLFDGFSDSPKYMYRTNLTLEYYPSLSETYQFVSQINTRTHFFPRTISTGESNQPNNLLALPCGHFHAKSNGAWVPPLNPILFSQRQACQNGNAPSRETKW